jgi:hypothetical protein
MPDKKKKTYVLTISKKFFKGHIREFQDTGFKKAILAGIINYHAAGKPAGGKVHTIRGNYDRWKIIADKVNAGEAELSLREWTGTPYRSKQEEFARLTKLGIQKFEVIWYTFHFAPLKIMGHSGGTERVIKVKIDGEEISFNQYHQTLPNNDGLSIQDFTAWFNDQFSGAIIHFTDFKY